MEKKYYYKAMDKDMQCRGFQFKVEETYTIESEDLEICSDKVFHFCEKLEDTIDYYWNPTDRHFLIEVLGNIVTKNSKSGSNKIRIVREISREEIEKHIQNKSSYNAKVFLTLYTTNIEMLEILYKDKNGVVRWAVASNPNTPVYILKKLAKDKEWEVRRAVAENPNAPVQILKHLVTDENWAVRKVVATNPNTPVYILEMLSKDEDWEVRYWVTLNKNTPIYILEYLSKDKDWEVRGAIAEHLNTSIDILEELAKDENEDVSKKAQEKLKEITQ